MELVPHRVRVASYGAAHTLFLTSTGVAFACGLGSYGRLGTGARESLLTPRMLASLEQTVVVQVSAGARHSAFVTEGGQVYMAGDDGSGQCAANSHTALALRTPAVPPKFAEGTGATVLGASCGTDHTAYVLKTVVDANFDLRADQIMKAAAVLQKIGRGAAVRRMRAPAAKKRVPQHASPQERRAARQADAKAEDDRRAAAAKVIQHGARSKAVRKKEARPTASATRCGARCGAGSRCLRREAARRRRQRPAPAAVLRLVRPSDKIVAVTSTLHATRPRDADELEQNFAAHAPNATPEPRCAAAAVLHPHKRVRVIHPLQFRSGRATTTRITSPRSRNA